MWKYLICTLLFGGQTFATYTFAENYLSLYVCENNRSIAVQIFSQDTFVGTSCHCHASPSVNPTIREDYVFSPGIGSHKLHTAARNWNDARKVCNEENAHLAVINSLAEENVLVRMLQKASPAIRGAANTDQALIGIHDLFKEGEWVTVFGESLYATGYSRWSQTYYGGQPDNLFGNQNCGTILRTGGMDDVFCHDKFAFICELPLTC